MAASRSAPRRRSLDSQEWGYLQGIGLDDQRGPAQRTRASERRAAVPLLAAHRGCSRGLALGPRLLGGRR
eukprot:9025838-Pyramimonas_sp.AAC.1